MKQSKFKETEIGKVPEGWDIQEVKDLGKVITGKTPPTKEGKYFGKDYPFIKIPDMGMCVRVENSETMLSREGAQYMCSLKLPPDSVMVSCLATIGKVGITAKESFTNQQINSVIPNINKVIPEWIYYYFSNNTEYLESLGGGGSVYTNISKSRFESAKIILPRLTEQRAITKILSDLDAKIELNVEMNKTLEAIGQALFKRWFVDFEFPNNEGKPYKSSGGEMVDSELGDIPEGWEVREIKECGKVVCGKTPSTRHKENYGDDIAFITIPDMRDQVFVVTTERKLSHIGAESQRKKELPPLSICVSCIATPGLVSLTYERSHTNQQINSIVCSEDINQYFMYYTMVNKRGQIRTMGLGGTATLNLNTGDFSKIKVIVPGKADMLRFGRLTQPMFDRMLGNVEKNLNLSKIRDFLLALLMS